MIRRQQITSDGTRRWILVPQIEHARLSGDLARRWGGRHVQSLEPREELLAAIYHHDDGWRRWQSAPGVDPESGKPRSFTEMPLEASLPIWSESILVAADIGPLAGWAVSGHFCDLLRHSHFADEPAAVNWLAEQDAARAGWFARWAEIDPEQNTVARADRALAHLQMFDALSLWFCCAARADPHTVDTPGGLAVTVEPQDEATMSVDPWPFTESEVRLTATGRAIPVARYADAQSLAAVPSASVTLAWLLRPAGMPD